MMQKNFKGSWCEFMARKAKIRIALNDTRHIKQLKNEEIAKILRAADEIIGKAGRAMLVKILKGSKDKKVLEHALDQCPSYGYYSQMKMADIEVIVDWMIKHNYLKILYDGRLPMIIFTGYGWEVYKPIFAEEMLNKIINVPKDGEEALVEEFRTVNREVINLILDQIIEQKLSDTISFLEKWKIKAYKKDASKINYTIKKLQN
jgi:superfamily II DNA helicase RecQ